MFVHMESRDLKYQSDSSPKGHKYVRARLDITNEHGLSHSRGCIYSNWELSTKVKQIYSKNAIFYYFFPMADINILL